MQMRIQLPCAAAIVLFCCTACSVQSQTPPMSPSAASFVSQKVRPQTGHQFLYVGGGKLSEFALGESTPRRRLNPDLGVVALAFDPSSGILYAGNGSISWGTLSSYDAKSLTPLNTFNGIDGIVSLAVDRSEYLYAARCTRGILVFAPGGTKLVNQIQRGTRRVCGLAFDGSGQLYAANDRSVNVYAPAQNPGHLKLVRTITDGIDRADEIAFGPSGQLYVVNRGSRRGFVSVYAAGGSAPVRRITTAIDAPVQLAVDSANRLYVANAPWGPGGALAGWVSAYNSDGKLLRKITDGIDHPTALALDSSGELYATNPYHRPHGSVTVYSAGGAALLRTIVHGIAQPSSLLTASP
jgi:sugar lactone lactonase YvrE